jgi:hypothetical protein
MRRSAMAKKSLRSQLNQIRAWVRQGRTDAWIAHQLEVPAAELREFRRRHDLTSNGEDPSDVDLRDEIEAEIEAATLAAEEEEEEIDAEEPIAGVAAEPAPEPTPADAAAEPAEGRRRRRRRRRGGRGRGGGGKTLEGTFDHGETEGYGLWLDPAVADDPVYAENWKGHRAVEVQIDPDRIVIRRVESD